MTAADLKAWRRALRLDRPRAAAALAVPLRTYGNWEYGRPIPPPICLLAKYVQKYGGIA